MTLKGVMGADAHYVCGIAVLLEAVERDVEVNTELHNNAQLASLRTLIIYQLSCHYNVFSPGHALFRFWFTIQKKTEDMF